ncbi:MAG: MmgE/PrpD family protein [Desulfocapsaceae bacterium]
MESIPENLTRTISESCVQTDFTDLSEEVVDRTKYLLLDFLGCAVRGTLADSTSPVLKLAERKKSVHEQTPIIGTDRKSEPSFAALAVGTAAHSLELDDVVNSGSLHPAVAVIPAALSTGYGTKCSGVELLTSIVIGYELMVKLGIALKPTSHYRQGFHPTGTCGAFGAAAASAKIMKLSASEFSHALGIAGSQAAGSLEFLSDGAFTKRLHAGWAAHSGIIAADLAREGFTGPGTIIEGKFGFLHGYSQDSDPEAVLKNWSTPWEVMNSSIKPHACCRYKQGPIDCIMEIMEFNDLQPEEIERVEIAILDAGFDLVAEPVEKKLNPLSVVDAQFSMPFGAALAILRKDAFLNRYQMDEINDPGIRECMKRIHCIREPELNKKFPRKWPARVAIQTTDGKKFEHRLDHPKGDPENPLSWDELIVKFTSLATEVLPLSQCRKIVELVRNVDQIKDVSELVDVMRVA